MRRNAPGDLTLQRVARFFAARRYPRTSSTIGDFERGKYLEVADRFIELWSEAVGQDPAHVREVLERVQRQRARGTGPFADRKMRRKKSG